ncbi:hydroxymethylglutaryl-CoA lyase [Candidatus Nanopelagicales bacterium]|nr:hydroxymethylglutaryl-CoA lyase [Candidatus Nanopelagicales bacterium]
MNDTGLPEVAPQKGMPTEVTIWEVGARDGLQNEATALSTQTKVEFINRLSATGLAIVEATSFVSPQWVPQLADAQDVMAELSLDGLVRYPVLVPNVAGLQRAEAAGVRDIAVFASATETFAKKNLNRTLSEQMTMFAPVIQGAKDRGMSVRGYVSMCFGDPWEGVVPKSQVVSVCGQLLAAGCDSISLGDTIGVATPGQVQDLIVDVTRFVDIPALAVHFHDTFGQALSNTYAALQAGVTTIDSSAGGLGGCPYAKSATGNLATEDLIWMLDGLGIATGVDLAALVQTSRWLAEKLGRPSPSRVVRALP